MKFWWNFYLSGGVQYSVSLPLLEKTISPICASQSTESSWVFFINPDRRFENVTCLLVLFSILFTSIFPLPIITSSLSTHSKQIKIKKLLWGWICWFKVNQEWSNIYTRSSFGKKNTQIYLNWGLVCASEEANRSKLNNYHQNWKNWRFMVNKSWTKLTAICMKFLNRRMKREGKERKGFKLCVPCSSVLSCWYLGFGGRSVYIISEF